LEFKDSNASILSKYPSSTVDLSKIMKAVKSGVMTVDQVCRGLYGSVVPERERRAKDAALGKPIKGEARTTVSSADRSSVKSIPTTLSSAERQLKHEVEISFLGGQKMTDAEFKEYSKK